MPLFRFLVEDMKYRIVECDVVFTKDNVPVLMHNTKVSDLAIINHKYIQNNVEVDDITYKELLNCDFSMGGGNFLKVTTFEELLRYAKRKNICIQMDLQKHVFSKERMRILYAIVKKHGMINKVIWEVSDENFYTITSIDKNLIIQLDQKWNRESIEQLKPKRDKASLIILSNWFENFDNIEYEDIIKYGHENDFLMKCSIVNDSCVANQLFDMGVDLIVTDCLQ